MPGIPCREPRLYMGTHRFFTRRFARAVPAIRPLHPRRRPPIPPVRFLLRKMMSIWGAASVTPKRGGPSTGSSTATGPYAMNAPEALAGTVRGSGEPAGRYSAPSTATPFACRAEPSRPMTTGEGEARGPERHLRRGRGWRDAAGHWGRPPPDANRLPWCCGAVFAAAGATAWERMCACAGATRPSAPLSWGSCPVPSEGESGASLDSPARCARPPRRLWARGCLRSLAVTAS